MTRRRRGRSAKEKASTSAALVAHPEHAQAALTSDVDRGQGRAPAPQVTGASGGIGLVTATEFLCTWPACVPVGADLQSPRLPRCAVRRRVMRHGMIRPRRQSVAALQWQRTRSLRQHVPPTLANAGARLYPGRQIGKVGRTQNPPFKARAMALAIWSRGTTCEAKPAVAAAPGIPQTTELGSSWQMIVPPASTKTRPPSRPS